MVPGDEDILPRKRGRQEVGDKHALSLHKAPGARMTVDFQRGLFTISCKMAFSPLGWMFTNNQPSLREGYFQGHYVHIFKRTVQFIYHHFLQTHTNSVARSIVFPLCLIWRPYGNHFSFPTTHHYWWTWCFKILMM